MVKAFLSGRRRALCVVCCLWAVVTPAAADFNDGVSAYLKGDYEAARQHLLPLAETADHGLSMYFLGMMYLQGRGGRQDAEEAGDWMLRAARQGVPQAQYKLGRMYMQGEGLTRDYEAAYAWLSTASLHEHAGSRQALQVVQDNLNEEELREAKRLAEVFARDFGPRPDTESAGSGS